MSQLGEVAAFLLRQRMAQDEEVKSLLLNQISGFGHCSCGAHRKEGSKHQVTGVQKRPIPAYDK